MSLEEKILNAVSSISERFPKLTDGEETASIVSGARAKVPTGFPVSLLEISGKLECFRAVFVLPEFSSSNIDTFVKAYSLLNDETLRISSTRYDKSGGNLAEKSYRCQHNTRYEPTRDPEKALKANPSRRLKNTGCRFLLSFKLQEDNKCRLTLEWNHNHPITCLQALTYKDISESTKTKIFAYFHQNLTPSLAYRQYIEDIRKLSNLSSRQV